MATSDLIARFILEMLEDSDGSAELQRSVLADRFGCVPSQINYVISTRFSPERGYVVESRRGGGGYIRITLREDAGYYVVAIEDNGPGVKDEDIVKLFKPNFTTKSSGTGLGLAICRNIIEQSGGRISYRRSDLGGACFSFSLPVYN